jgi:dTDP-4-dehydrorhamnose reductase
MSASARRTQDTAESPLGELATNASFVVTGAGGQVGTALTRRLGSLGIDHVALSSSDLDITSPQQIRDVLSRYRPSVVINCAAYNLVDKAEESPEVAYRINRDAVSHLAAACTEFGSILVHYSTDFVFDGQHDDPYTEEMSVHPLGVYGSSKLAGERAVLDSDGAHLVLRVSWVFGRLGTSFVDDVLRWAQSGPLRVVTDQKSVPCDAVGLASATVDTALRLIENPELSGLYHFAMGPPISRFEYAEAIVSRAVKLGIIAPVELLPVSGDYFPSAAKRPANSALDGSKFERQFGIDPGDWRRGLYDYLETLKRQ